MKNLLFLLVLTSSANAAWQEGNLDDQTTVKRSAPRLIGGGGGNGEAEKKHRISVQSLIVPTNPPINNPNIAMPVSYHPSSRCPSQNKPNISIGMNQNSIEVVDLRGQLEAQNIDIRDNTGCFERMMKALSTWCGSRDKRTYSPPRLVRTNSVYPGR